MHLYLIRHAESENNAKPAYQRVEDPGLTAIGQLQAQHLGLWLQTLRYDTLITSPFRRALQTAKQVVQIVPQQLHIWHDVFERGGCFRGHGPAATDGGEGLSRAGIKRLMQCDAGQLTIDGSIVDQGWWNCQDRETDAEAAIRAAHFHTRIVKEFGHTEKRVVVITHADFMELCLREILSDALDTERLGLLRNTGITKLSYFQGQWRIDWINSVSHLPARLCSDS